MSILGSSDQKIEIKLYYKEIKSDGYSKVVIIPDEDAKDLLKKQEEFIKKKEDAEEKITDEDRPIKTLITKWSILKWGEQNQITSQSKESDTNGVQSVDYFRFRDLRIKKCLVDWNVTDEKGNVVPLNDKTIDMLPSDFVLELLSRYDILTSIDEDETEKN